jgi:phage baseplate assembly protein gpV
VPASAEPTATGGSGALWLFDEELAAPDQMESLAQAALDHNTADAVTVNGVAWGNPRLQPGTRVAVSGVADSMAGQYVLTSVIHTIEPERGYLTQFETAPPPLLARPRGTVATLGVVTQVDDPQGLGRVRVSLPAYDDVETDWMQVLSPGAGVNKGLVALPDPGDNVLVLCVRQNPAQGLIIGGIYGPFAPYDPGVEGGQVRRYSLRTPGGHLIRLDDEENSLRLEHRDGSFVEMTSDTMRIHAEADLELTAPGKRIVIRGEQIDFERG